MIPLMRVSACPGEEDTRVQSVKAPLKLPSFQSVINIYASSVSLVLWGGLGT